MGQFPALDLCAGCGGDLRRNAAACVICAESLSGEAVAGRTGLSCGACLRRRPRFDSAYCPYLYAYPLDHLVKGLKYQGRVAQGRVLGELLAQALGTSRVDPWPEMLIPVPLAPRRFRQRGYNQALELGQRVERHLHIPLATDVIERTRETVEQAGLDQRERRRNIKGAFAVRRIPSARHVAIIDDVITTGSTANEMSRVLKRAGVRRVEVWAVARASKQPR